MVDPSLIEAEQTRQPGDSAALMIIPVLALVLSMPLGLFITGGGDLTAGSGSTSVLWAVLVSLAVAWTIALVSQRATLETLMQLFLKGAGGLLPVAMILLFSLALGDVANELGTGVYVAQLAQETIPSSILLPLLFLLSAFIAFSIRLKLGHLRYHDSSGYADCRCLRIERSVFLAAVLSGAVFGDHASPISDTDGCRFDGSGYRSYRSCAHATALRIIERGLGSGGLFR